MLNFYVVSASRGDMVTHAGSYHVQVQIQSPIIITKSTKNEGDSENMGFDGKKFEDFGQKKHFWPRPNNPVEHTAPEYNNWIWPLSL